MHTQSQFFKKLQFLKLNDIFKLQQLKFYYKLIKGDLPKYFQHFSYIHNFEIHHHYTRETSSTVYLFPESSMLMHKNISGTI